MTISTLSSSSAANGGNGKGGSRLLQRIRTSFSSTHRPVVSADTNAKDGKSSEYGSMRRHATNHNDSGVFTQRAYNSERGLGNVSTTDVRPAKHRQSIFRRVGRHAKTGAASSALPPQLPIMSVAEQESSMDSYDSFVRIDAQQRSSLAETPVPFHSKAASTRKRLEYHLRARLTVPQACTLLDQCAKEIKMRGLAMVGIFRPFRSSESSKELERLIELFLLAAMPEVYQGIFALHTATSSALARETLGRPDPEAEFRRKLGYANVHDVVVLYKWGLRRLMLRPSDLHSTQQYGWYDEFVQAEKVHGYPPDAFSTLLLPRFDGELAPLLRSIFDLMSTVSAHHVNNAMPAWRLSRTLGYWLFGRVGVDHRPSDFRSVYAAWERAGQVTEHLLLAFVREQASNIHLMPSRLTELIAGYPYIAPDRVAPSVPPSFVPLESTALYVETRIDNFVLTSKQARRAPRETLAAALKARNVKLQASEDLDDWMAIIGSAKEEAKSNAEAIELLAEDGEQLELLDTHDSQLDADNHIAMQEMALFKEEDVRVLEITSAELQKRREAFEWRASEANSASVLSAEASGMPASLDSLSSVYSRDSFGSSIAYAGSTLSQSTSNNNLQSSLGASGLVLAPLSEGDDETEMQSWNAFATGGFAGDKSVDSAELQLNEKFRPKKALEKAFEEQDRRDAIAAMKKSRRSRASEVPVVRGPSHPVLVSVSSATFFDCFVGVWQDQLLDDCADVRLPNLLFAQLNRRTANRLLGNAAMTTGTSSLGGQWLILDEKLDAPQPPLPPGQPPSFLSRRSTFRRKGGVKHMQSQAALGNSDSGDSSGWNAQSRNEDDDRQSLFSIRSGLSAHFKRPGESLRRMRSMLLVRKDTPQTEFVNRSEVWSDASTRNGAVVGPIAAPRQADVIDAEVAELKAAMQADRKRRREQHQKDHPQQPPLDSPTSETGIAPVQVVEVAPPTHRESTSHDTTNSAVKDGANVRDSIGVQSRTESRPDASMYSARSTLRSQYEDVQDDF